MIQKKIETELIGKNVVNSSGIILGVLDDIVFDNDTGEIKFLLLRTAGKTVSNAKTDGKGRAIIPFSMMSVTESSITIT